jgi:hypothetical protein
MVEEEIEKKNEVGAEAVVRSPRSGDQDHVHRGDFYKNFYQNGSN